MFPVIIQEGDIDTVKHLSAKHITSMFPEYIGKYKFEDTIHYKGQRERQLESEEEYRWETNPIFGVDSLSSDGLQIIPDYKTSLAFNGWEDIRYLYYPVYVVNETFEPKIFYGKDGHGFAIQEACDTSNYPYWFAIEFQGLDFCGNGRFRKKVNPGEYLLFLMPKYSGTFSTSIRIRFQIGQSTFISKPFPGIIDSGQFKINKKHWVHSRLKETRGTACSWLFYGGIPKEIDKYYEPE